MKRLILLLVAVVCAGCMSPHEGEFAHVANLELEGMAWRVKCGETTQRKLNERLIRGFTITDTEDAAQYTFDISVPRVGLVRDHYWASVELAACTQ